MLRHLLLSTAAIALAVAVATGPAGAQTTPPSTLVQGVEIEGPITSIDPSATGTVPTTILPPGTSSLTYVGEMVVMGVTVRVRSDAVVHTPTVANLGGNADAGVDLMATGPFRGRTEPGFIGGTGIITGDSVDGVIYATDVFSDLFEHVVVGEATTDLTVDNRITVNNMQLRRSADPRMPAGAPINGFGLRIVPSTIDKGTLISAEGYYSPTDRVLYYHTLEADSAQLANKISTQVSILRAECRVRGGGRDEIQVRGGVVNPATASVQIRIPAPTRNNPERFLSIGSVDATLQAPADPLLGNPAQGLYNADFRNLNLINPITGANECPAQVRAVILATSPGALNQASATADMEGR